MQAIQTIKPNQTPIANKPTLMEAKPKKIMAYTPEELRKSIERKKKRKLELQAHIIKIDEKIVERENRLQQITKKIN